jgi:hypothetical protein
MPSLRDSPHSLIDQLTPSLTSKCRNSRPRTQSGATGSQPRNQKPVPLERPRITQDASPGTLWHSRVLHSRCSWFGRRSTARAITTKPLVDIGGINRSNCAAVSAAGPDARLRSSDGAVVGGRHSVAALQPGGSGVPLTRRPAPVVPGARLWTAHLVPRQQN